LEESIGTYSRRVSGGLTPRLLSHPNKSDKKLKKAKFDWVNIPSKQIIGVYA